MDDPALDRELHAEALRGLATINRVSRSADMLWPTLRRAAREKRSRGRNAGLGEPLSVLDVACGGGDVVTALATKAHAAGLPMRFTGCDVSEVALEACRREAERAGVTVAFERRDVLAEALPEGFDVVMSSLFLHHLTAEQAVRLLEKMRAAAGCRVLVNDLRRSTLGYVAAWLGTRLLSRSAVVHTDGPMSVRAAWTVREMKALANAAGLSDVSVRRRFPWRMLLKGVVGGER